VVRIGTLLRFKERGFNNAMVSRYETKHTRL